MNLRGPANAPDERRPAVLVCDDEHVLHILVRASPDPALDAVVEARDGDEALERMCECRPDLTLLDIMMPERSGSEVLAEMRADPVSAELPVIFLTARAQAADRASRLESGADRSLCRPFGSMRLCELARKVPTA